MWWEMKGKFSYQRYLAGEKVITREGWEVLHIYAEDTPCFYHLDGLLCVVRKDDGCIMAFRCSREGVMEPNGAKNPFDLFMENKRACNCKSNQNDQIIALLEKIVHATPDGKTK